MPTAPKPKPTSTAYSRHQIAAAKAAATPPTPAPLVIDWKARGIVTPGGGVAATLGALRKARGKNKKPIKEQVAIRFDVQVLAAFREGGPGWQTRINAALKEWLDQQRPSTRKRGATSS